ncbi:MAG: FAD-binding protein [Legionella sp.]|nr:FAD-binding protein [Legionella sp.]
MSTLVLVEHDNKRMHPAMRNVLTAALAFQTPITYLVAGYQCRTVAEEVATLAGVHQVFYVDHETFNNPTAEQISTLVCSLQPQFTYILAPATTFGKNCAPRIAALLDVAQVSDVTKIINKDTLEHPIYAGNALETVKVLDEIKVLTIRPTAFDAVTQQQPACTVTEIAAPEIKTKTQFVSHELSQSERPDLASAKVVVSGGRGLQDAEKFKIIEELADTLGAAVGASRAAVDAGFVPNDYQVGQTGKIVAPSLYIAIGISGAVQHLAGMKDSKVIVAINKDEDAPIFQIADYGLVGDLFEIVPEMIQKIKNH